MADPQPYVPDPGEMADRLQRRAERILRLEAENERLREALRWYADENRYDYDETCVPVGAPDDEDVLADRGQIARDALGGDQ